MSEEKITKINKIGKISAIIARVVMVCMIIAAVATGALTIAATAVPADIAKVDLNGTATIQIDQKYLELGKNILSEVNDGMTEEGQTLDIAGAEYEYISADVKDDTVSINYKSDGNKLSVRNLARMFGGTFLSSLNCVVLLFFILALCKELQKCRSPFDDSVIKRMKNLAIALIPWIVVHSISLSLVDTAFAGKFSLDNGNSDIGVVLVVFVMIALIYVFKYGADLQQQSDETL